MDDHGQLEYATASGNDYPSHEQMYRTFVTLTKSFVAVIAVIGGFPHLNAERVCLSSLAADRRPGSLS